ncbi:MAG TPA: GNAT family N-acetyltransferase [Flavobacteriales bacterium]
MLRLHRTDTTNEHFRLLVTELDEELSVRNGESNAFYMQFNKLDGIKHAVVIDYNNIPVGCGAIKHYDSEAMEVKRMYVLPAYRGKGLAQMVLQELERWTLELNYSACILETGLMQPEAIALYKNCNYTIIPNYGPYKGDEKSVCFRKELNSDKPE